MKLILSGDVYEKDLAFSLDEAIKLQFIKRRFNNNSISLMCDLGAKNAFNQLNEIFDCIGKASDTVCVTIFISDETFIMIKKADVNAAHITCNSQDNYYRLNLIEAV